MRFAFTALLLLAGASFAQTFEASDVRVSAKTSTFPFLHTGPVRGGRYEAKTATMVDLIRLAYGFDADKILGGPSWLEMERYDVVAKVPAGSNPETQKEMLQALLADRFGLVVHKETKPLPAYALMQGKKPQLKEAAGTESAGCKPDNGPVQEGGSQLRFSLNGEASSLTLGPGMTALYHCRNMSMDGFVAALRTMIGANLGTNPVMNETGLQGAYNFDIRFSLSLNGLLGGGSAERITLSEAIDKQLGLRLEEKQVPTPVLVVDKVNRKPTDNAPDIAQILPPIPMPTEFEVASIKPSEPAGPGPRMSRFQTLPGNRVVVDKMPLHFLVARAFNTNNNEEIVGLPKFADTDLYDIVAKAPAGGPATQLDMEAVAPLVKALLVDRFKMKYHREERPVMAYTLTGSKPKMKKADPNSRSWCKYPPAPAGAPPGTRIFSCQNVTMDEFVERLQNIAPELIWPVTNSTELEGTWDLTLTFSMGRPPMIGARTGGDAPGTASSPAPSASDPTGGYTFLEAIEKQLGLKLEKQKRTVPVIVIDSIEQKPTEN